MGHIRSLKDLGYSEALRSSEVDISELVATIRGYYVWLFGQTHACSTGLDSEENSECKLS